MTTISLKKTKEEVLTVITQRTRVRKINIFCRIQTIRIQKNENYQTEKD